LRKQSRRPPLNEENQHNEDEDLHEHGAGVGFQEPHARLGDAKYERTGRRRSQDLLR
jgi:hypothetical protein